MLSLVVKNRHFINSDVKLTKKIIFATIGVCCGNLTFAYWQSPVEACLLVVFFLEILRWINFYKHYLCKETVFVDVNFFLP